MTNNPEHVSIPIGKVFDETLSSLRLPKLKVFVCTFAQESNVRRLVVDLQERFRDIVKDVTYIDLTKNVIQRVISDLESDFRSSNSSVIILCHSLNNRRYAITNGHDSRQYGGFLVKIAEILGKDRVCVIAYDMPTEQTDTSEKYDAEKECFRQQQPGTFNSASLVIIGGRLDGPVPELQHGHWESIQQFLKYAAIKPAVQRMSKIQGVLNIVNGFLNGVGYVCKQTYHGLGWGWNKLFSRHSEEISDMSDESDESD